MEVIFDSKFFDIRIVSRRKDKLDCVIINKPDGITVLGYINWFPKWRKYVFTSAKESTIVFDEICLDDIVSFLRVMNK